MNKIVMLTCGMLMVSSVALAEETTPETCANGAGTVVIGAVSGHKYCHSNKTMNWWNTVAWCDAQGKKLFNLNDCQCDGTKNCNSLCPELVITKNVGIYVWTSTITPSATNAYYVRPSDGFIGLGGQGFRDSDNNALCK